MSSPGVSKSPKIFISYSHADAVVAESIKIELASIKLNPWIDSIEIEPGDSISERMNEGLSNSSYMLALISKDSSISRWVNREWMAALANRDIVFIPILLDDTPVPALIRDIRYIDLRSDVAKGIREIVQFFLLETSGGVRQQQQQQQSQQQQQQQQQQVPDPWRQQQQQQQQPPDGGWRQQQQQQHDPSGYEVRPGVFQQQQQQQPAQLTTSQVLQRDHPIRVATRRQVRLVARQCLDDDTALRAYCFDAEIAFSKLGGGGVEDKLIALLHMLEQIAELERFVIWLENEKRACVSAQIRILSTDPAWNWPK